MKPFKVYTPRDAHPSSRTMLTNVADMVGFIPNLFGVIAESPTALSAFIALNSEFSESSFDATSREIIQTAASVENACTYCVAGHTAFADKQNVSGDVIEAIRDNQPIADTKLEALNQFTRSVVRNKGHIPESEVERFLDAGYTRAQVLEVILGICVKTFSNLANNAIGIPLDEEFSQYEWNNDRFSDAA